MKSIKLRKFFQHFGFLSNFHRPKKLPNVLLFSMPRSGSTWLMELIWSQPGFKYVNEPLNLKGKNTWEQKTSGINNFKELYHHSAKEKLVKYFKGFIFGRYYYMNPNPIRKHSRFFTSRIVFKVIHGGECFINDIANNTNSKIIYLIRHPIAVALSRKQLPRTTELLSEFVLANFSAEEKRFAKETMARGDAMEKRIIAWCIQNKLALKQRTSDWLVVSYEDLITQPKKILNKVALHCDLPDVDKMIKSVSIPSAVTTQSESQSIRIMEKDASDRYELISKWRNKIKESDAKRYFEICKKMNIDFYEYDSDLPKNELFFN